MVTTMMEPGSGVRCTSASMLDPYSTQNAHEWLGAAHRVCVALVQRGIVIPKLITSYSITYCVRKCASRQIVTKGISTFQYLHSISIEPKIYLLRLELPKLQRFTVLYLQYIIRARCWPRVLLYHTDISQIRVWESI